MCACTIYMYHVCAVPSEAWRGHKDPLRPELELQVIVSYLLWVPGTEPGSSARAVHVLNYCAPLYCFTAKTYTVET